MLLCRFILAETGCRLGHDCPKLHPVDVDLARREHDAKQTSVICRSYASNAKCDNADCGLLHVSGALGPALELPKPQHIEPQKREGGASRGRGRRPQPIWKKEARDRKPGDQNKTPNHQQPKRLRNERPPNETKLTEDGPGFLALINQTRNKLRQLLDAHSHIKKYADITRNPEALERAVDMLKNFEAIRQGLSAVNALLDAQLRGLNGTDGATGAKSPTTPVECSTAHETVAVHTLANVPPQASNSIDAAVKTFSTEDLLAALRD